LMIFPATIALALVRGGHASSERTGMCFGVEKGPRLRGDRRPIGTPLTQGFTMAPGENGGLDRDVGRGDGRENPPGIFCSREDDQGDLPRAADFAEGGSEGCSIGCDGVSLRAW